MRSSTTLVRSLVQQTAATRGYSMLSCTTATSSSISSSSSSSSSSSLFSARPTSINSTTTHNTNNTSVRFYSRLPIIDKPVVWKFPFPTALFTDYPVSYEMYLWYHQQHPLDAPRRRSRLIVDIRHLPLSANGRMILKEMVGPRYNPTTHQITFRSSRLHSSQANENRVFQELEQALKETVRLEKMFQEGKCQHLTLDINDHSADVHPKLSLTAQNETEQKKRIDQKLKDSGKIKLQQHAICEMN